MDISVNRPLSWTTIEEAKQLAEAGLPVETADMLYTGLDGHAAPLAWASKPGMHPEDVPCWSLGALIGLLPEVLMDGIRCYPVIRKPMYTGQWQVAYVNGLYETLHYETSIEAVIEMLIWLLKNKLIWQTETKNG